MTSVQGRPMAVSLPHTSHLHVLLFRANNVLEPISNLVLVTLRNTFVASVSHTRIDVLAILIPLGEVITYSNPRLPVPS